MNPILKEKTCEEKISIQIHLVRAKASATHMPYRFTPDEWYIEILDKLILALTSAGKGYEILIHTDVSDEKSWKVPIGANRETLKYWKNLGIVNDEGRMALQNSTVLSGFKKYENVSIVSNIDPISAWEVMSGADFLLIGKSSFSFVGALLNGKGVVISPAFWSKGPRSWQVFESSEDIHQHSFKF